MGALESPITPSFLSGCKQGLSSSRSSPFGRCSCRTSEKNLLGRLGPRSPQTSCTEAKNTKFRFQGRQKAGRNWAPHSACTSWGDGGRASLQDLAQGNSLALRPGFASSSRQVAYLLPVRVKIMDEIASVGTTSILWSHHPDLGMAIKGVKAKVLL